MNEAYHPRYDHLIRLLRIARTLESGHLYNAAKLFWAAAFAEEVRATEAAGMPLHRHELEREMEIAIQDLLRDGADPELAAALETAQQATHENRTISWDEIPQVYVCRQCGELMLGIQPDTCPRCGAVGLTIREVLPAYLLEPVEPGRALEALVATADGLEDQVAGLSEEQMLLQPSPEDWSMRELLWHLLVSERLLASRIEKMLTRSNPVLQAEATWVFKHTQPESAHETLQMYLRSRRTTINRLKSLSTHDWHRTGQHEEFGTVTILQQVSYFAKHESAHLTQVEALCAAIKA